MWITGDVELPDEILDAHERGDLVFFVGAGASLGKPSNLPLFAGLSRKLARRASHPYSKRGGLDFFIGQLEALPQGFDAHEHTRNIISDPKSAFNPLHKAIVDLAGIGGQFRVVTTNYDNHLAEAAKHENITVPDIWYGPALPIGRDFAGLVYLHGSVLRPKNELILTDRDFGHAYITDAWATRFLLPMFDRFTVVFVGYSHDDAIMRYLALGLPSTTGRVTPKRFAFTNDPSNSKWEYLGIEAISYPVVGRDHGALQAALVAWSDRAKMGQTDHQSRLQDIVAGGTTMPAPDRDYLRGRLHTSAGVHDFAAATQQLNDGEKLQWLSWIEDQTEFQAIFAPRTEEPETVLLGDWFASTFIMSPTLNGAALHTLLRNGQAMSDSLYRTTIWAANELGKMDTSAANRWQALLATSIFGESAIAHQNRLMSLELDPMVTSLPVLSTMLRPFLKLERPWLMDESSTIAAHPEAKVAWTVDEYSLTQLLPPLVQRYTPGDRGLSRVLEESILSAYDLLDAYYGKRAWDPLSFTRSAIESHPQDMLREPIDAIIDALRDFGTRALPVWPDLPDRWWVLSRGLMQRLALHLIANDPERTADEKLQWLLDRSGLYDANLKHETYQVLRATVATASPRARAQVLDAASAGPVYPDDIPDRDRHVAYSKFNLLAWLNIVDPSWHEAELAFKAVQADNPTFGVREHPDFDTWMESGSWGGKPPIDIDEFIRTATEEPVAALRGLTTRDYSEHRFDEPTWMDALDLVRQVAERDPGIGVSLWDAAASLEDVDDLKLDLWRTLAEGWGKADLENVGTDVVERIAALLPDEASAPAVGIFLCEQIRLQMDVMDSPVLRSMRSLAASLWSNHGAHFVHRQDASLLSFAPLYLNSWPGHLTQYWNGEVDRRWRHSRENWSGLSDEESTALIALLHGNRDALDATQPGIAGELFFYFAADRDFAISHLLPLFMDAERHAFAWAPFLHHPRWNDRILAAGLLDAIVSEFDRLDELPESVMVQVFLRFVVSIITYSGIQVTDRRRLLDQTVKARNGSYAPDFARAVHDLLDSPEVDGVAVWHRWLGGHMERRLNGRPRVAGPDELSRWADLVPLVGQAVPAAVALFAGRSIGFGPGFFDVNLPDEDLVTHSKLLVNFFAERVRSTSDADYMTTHLVQKLVTQVRSSVGDSAASPLIEAAQHGGFLGTAM